MLLNVYNVTHVEYNYSVIALNISFVYIIINISKRGSLYVIVVAYISTTSVTVKSSVSLYILINNDRR